MDARRHASTCYLPTGAPKVAFATIGEAVDHIASQKEAAQFAPYRCELHGYHIGGRVPRRERAAYDSQTYSTEDSQ